jgi:hypothetical protein
MPTTTVGDSRALPARQRTAMLHQMLVVRHLAEHHVGVSSPNRDDCGVDFQVGEEAVAAAVLASLGPCDAMVTPAGSPRALDQARGDLLAHRDAVTACLFRGDGGDWPDVAWCDRLPMLFCRRSTEGPATDRPPLGGETVDGLDVEAAFPRVQRRLRAIRAGDGPGLIWLRTDRTADPVDMLVVRMVAAHQLDDNALRAIDADAAAVAEAAVAHPRYRI